MKHYFEKELPDQAIFLAGKAYRFELMETEDQKLIQLLTSAAQKHVGGVSVISQSEYENKKKQAASRAISKPPQREEVRQKLMPAQPRFKSQNRNASAVASAKLTPPEAAAIGAGQDITAFVPKVSRNVLS